MQKLISLLIGLAACAASAAPTFAAGWSLTADSPLNYTFDKAAINNPVSVGPNIANWDHRTTTDVSGSKVLLIAPFHLGVGYEDYSISQTFGGCGAGCVGKINTNLQIVDAVFDIPMRYLNLGLGYGAGQANADVLGGPPLTVRHAAVTQTFVTVGIPLGKSFDVHAGYHWVSVEKKVVAGGGGPSELLLSGEMLSAGLRLNF